MKPGGGIEVSPASIARDNHCRRRHREIWLGRTLVSVIWISRELRKRKSQGLKIKEQLS
jgi:hypothetical protein